MISRAEYDRLAAEVAELRAQLSEVRGGYIGSPTLIVGNGGGYARIAFMTTSNSDLEDCPMLEYAADLSSSSGLPYGAFVLSYPGGSSGIELSVYVETPTGTVDGSNTSFTLASTPGDGYIAVCFVDGVVVVEGMGGLTRSGAALTFDADYTPQSWLRVLRY